MNTKNRTKTELLFAAMATAYLAFTVTSINAAVVGQIDFTYNHPTPTGWNTSHENSTITPLLDPTGAATDIDMSIPNVFGWDWDQGPNVAYTAANGVVFPAGVTNQNVADNLAGSRDGHGVIRLASPTQYYYELTFLAAFDVNPGVTQFNVGGTWNAGTNSFDGGATIEIDPDVNGNPTSIKTGTLTTPSVWDAGAGAYIAELQVGNKTPAGDTVGGLNGLHVSGKVGAVPGTTLTAQVDFGRTAIVPATGWNRVDTSGTIANLLDPTGASTPIGLEITDNFGWTTSQGPNQPIVASNGVVFPAGSVVEFAGENESGGGRNNLAVVRLSTPDPYDYELTILSANDHGLTVDTLFNIGGTWENGSRSFTGGDTLTLDTASDVTGVMTASSQWNETEGAYIVDLQVGNPSGGSSVAGINGLHIAATLVPEPSAFLLAVVGALGLLSVRRRRRR